MPVFRDLRNSGCRLCRTVSGCAVLAGLVGWGVSAGGIRPCAHHGRAGCDRGPPLSAESAGRAGHLGRRGHGDGAGGDAVRPVSGGDADERRGGPRAGIGARFAGCGGHQVDQRHARDPKGPTASADQAVILSVAPAPRR